jgi:hypothetical protein
MKPYIGTKIVNAEPMTKNYFDSIKTPNTEFSGKDQEGYLVVYEDGYKSWSPKDTFERCYREITNKEKVIIGLNLL